MLKNPPANAGNARDTGSTPGLGRSPREGNSYPLQYSDLKNSMDCIVYGVAKSQTRLSDFHVNTLKMMYAKSLLQSLAEARVLE